VTDPSKWTRLTGAMVLALAATPALAEWARLGDDGIVAALTGAEVDYDGAAWQAFLPTGRTMYRVGEAPEGETSRGDWRVEAGNYCSRWPPSDTWTCYAVEVDGQGGVRFIDSWGNVSAGHFIEAAE
jgi:hypothetical protein